jgi:hypothetical protein
MSERPLSSLRCEYCGGEFRNKDRAKKDVWGTFYTTPGGYYLPFKCPRCGGLFCNAHRLPENHSCSGIMEPLPKKTSKPISTENRFNQEDYEASLPPQPYQPVNTENLFNQPEYEGPQSQPEKIEKLFNKPENKEPEKQNEPVEPVVIDKKDQPTASKKLQNPQANRFSQMDYNKTVFRENFSRYFKVGLLLSLLTVGFYCATNTTLLSDLNSFIQTETSAISYGIASIRNNTETNGMYKNFQLGLVKESGGIIVNSHDEYVVLINNKYAKNPTYVQLLAFLKSDKTDEYTYQNVITIHQSRTGAPEDYVNVTRIKEILNGLRQQKTPYICSDFAEMLHNNAEMTGIRCAFVSIDVGGSPHALNAFETTDRGIVYVDCTGSSRSPKPSNCDKVIEVLQVESEYVPRSLFPEPGWSSTYQSLGEVTNIFISWDGEWR